MSTATLAFVFVYIAAVGLPSFALVGVVIAAIVQLFSTIVRLSAGPRASTGVPSSPGDGRPPFFSVHLATRDEPAEIVLKTLEALRLQDFHEDRYEIIVIDNNTSDPALWRPVELYSAVGSNVRFYHFENVEGAKAAALNIALARTSRSATHVVTIDADYVVDRDFLSRAERALDGNGYDYIQFPQAYSRPTEAGGGLDLELADYFKTYARPANAAEAALLTGTLSVIDKRALEDIGGWCDDTVTEDAELGARLCLHGYSGRYVDRVVGRGIMPLSFEALSRQRFRWTAGNVRTLFHHGWLGRAPSRKIGLARWRLIVSQLLAWPNAALVPAAALLGSLHATALIGLAQSPTRQFVANLAAATLFLVLASAVASVLFAAIRERWSAKDAAVAVATRLALVPVSARAAVEGAICTRIRFVVTPKTIRNTNVASLRGLRDHAAIFAGAGIAVLATVFVGDRPLDMLAIVICVPLMCLLPLGFVAAGEIEAYRRSLASKPPGDL